MITVTYKMPWVDDAYVPKYVFERIEEAITMEKEVVDHFKYSPEKKLVLTIEIEKAPTTTQEPTADVPPTSGDDWIVSDKKWAVK